VKQALNILNGETENTNGEKLIDVVLNNEKRSPIEINFQLDTKETALSIDDSPEPSPKNEQNSISPSLLNQLDTILAHNQKENLDPSPEISEDITKVEHSESVTFSSESKALMNETFIAHDFENHLKPYYCRLCNKRFGYLPNAKAHMRTVHMKERRHVCEFCGQKFTRRNNWRDHIKKKHSEHVDMNFDSYGSKRVKL